MSDKSDFENILSKDNSMVLFDLRQENKSIYNLYAGFVEFFEYLRFKELVYFASKPATQNEESFCTIQKQYIELITNKITIKEFIAKNISVSLGIIPIKEREFETSIRDFLISFRNANIPAELQYFQYLILNKLFLELRINDVFYNRHLVSGIKATIDINAKTTIIIKALKERKLYSISFEKSLRILTKKDVLLFLKQIKEENKIILKMYLYGSFQNSTQMLHSDIDVGIIFIEDISETDKDEFISKINEQCISTLNRFIDVNEFISEDTDYLLERTKHYEEI